MYYGSRAHVKPFLDELIVCKFRNKCDMEIPTQKGRFGFEKETWDRLLQAIPNIYAYLQYIVQTGHHCTRVLRDNATAANNLPNDLYVQIQGPLA